MLKKFTNKKGFTLMEMLIVVAIIAILIAVAIPTFNNALNKAKVGTDTANIRSGYAAAKVEVLTGKVNKGDTYTLNADGSVKAGAGGDYTTVGKPAEDVKIGESTVTKWDVGQTVTYTVGDDGAITIKVGT